MNAKSIIAFLGSACLTFSCPAFADERTIYVISDLHLGLGRLADNPDTWHPMEDFRWPNALKGFLDEISTNRQDNDLVIAGDFLELWQLPENIQCDSPDKNYGCSVAELETMVRLITRAHSVEFTALANFARSGTNCIHIIPGNHDAALLIDSVWKIVYNVLDQGNGCVFRADSGVWKSPAGRHVVEHGHQIGKDANRYDNWPNVSRIIGGVERIERPWGEKFVQDIFNQDEQEYQLIDNLKPKSSGLRYRAADRGIRGSVEDIAKFLKFNLFATSWKQKKAILGAEDDAIVEWDTAKGREMGYQLLLLSLPTRDPFRKQLQSGEGEWAALRTRLDEQVRNTQIYSDEDIEVLCDKLAALNAKNKCVETTAGAALQGLFSSRTRVIRNHVKNRKREYERMTVFSYGHTHSFELNREVSVGRNRSVNVSNSGAFQRLIDDEWLMDIAEEKSISTAEVLKKVPLEDLPACYTFVQIIETEGVPYPRVRAWVMKETDRRGHFADPCKSECPNVSHNCN